MTLQLQLQVTELYLLPHHWKLGWPQALLRPTENHENESVQFQLNSHHANKPMVSLLEDETCADILIALAENKPTPQSKVI